MYLFFRFAQLGVSQVNLKIKSRNRADVVGSFVKNIYAGRKVSDNGGKLCKFNYELARSAEIRGRSLI